LARRNFIEEYLKAVEVPKKAQVPENSARCSGSRERADHLSIDPDCSDWFGVPKPRQCRGLSAIPRTQ